MSRPKLAAALVAALLALVLAAVAIPSAGAKAGKVDLLKPPFAASCNAGVTSGGTETDAFAVINFHGGEVSATVSIKDGLPDATYSVRLVQTPSGSDCFVQDAVLTTNAQGNGTIHISETALASTTGAFVVVLSGTDGRVSENVAA